MHILYIIYILHVYNNNDNNAKTNNNNNDNDDNTHIYIYIYIYIYMVTAPPRIPILRIRELTTYSCIKYNESPFQNTVNTIKIHTFAISILS